MNRLKGLRCYLAGPIDHAEDDGVGWRNVAKMWLEQRGVVPMDPCDKPTDQAEHREIGEEKIQLMKLKQERRFDELTTYMKGIAHIDLRMLDRSDFVIVYIDMDAKPFGTIWELQQSLNQRKPTLVFLKAGKESCSLWLYGVMNHNYMFDTMGELFTYLNDIDKGLRNPDLTRWVFFDEA